MSETSPQPEALLSYQQAADALGVSSTFVERLVGQRRIPFVKLGHYVRIRRTDLEAYIEAARVPASGE